MKSYIIITCHKYNYGFRDYGEAMIYKIRTSQGMQQGKVVIKLTLRSKFDYDHNPYNYHAHSVIKEHMIYFFLDI